MDQSNVSLQEFVAHEIEVSFEIIIRKTQTRSNCSVCRWFRKCGRNLKGRILAARQRKVWERKFLLSATRSRRAPMKSTHRRSERTQKIFATHQTENPLLDRLLPSPRQLYRHPNRIYLQMKLTITKTATWSNTFHIRFQYDNQSSWFAVPKSEKKFAQSMLIWRTALRLQFEMLWRTECGCWVSKTIRVTIRVRQNGSCSRFDRHPLKMQSFKNCATISKRYLTKS